MYNDRFNDIDAWQVDVDAGATVEGVGNEIKITIPDDPLGFATADYQYFIGSGEYDLTIDITDYVPNDSSNGHFIFVLNYDGIIGTAQDLVSIRYNVENAGATHNVVSQLRLGGDNQDNTVNPASRPSKVRFIRESSVLKVYYYISSWVLIDSRDFGGSASNIVKIRLLSIDKSSKGGYATFDNLIFNYGCPAGYPKVWTTTTSTSSSSTTTTT